MNCHETRAELLHYLNDELSASERELLRAHVAGCEACFAEMQNLGTTQRLLRVGLQAATERIAPSDQAWGKLRASIQSDQAPTHKQPSPHFFLRALGAAFAAISVVVGAMALRPEWTAKGVPTSEATAFVQTQPAPRASAVLSEPTHRQLAALLKSEPKQSVQTAILVLFETDAPALDAFTCRQCPRIQ